MIGAGAQALHLLGVLALVLGLLLLCTGRPTVARGVLTAQAVAVGLGAAALAVAAMSVPLGLAALVLLAGAVLAWRIVVPATPPGLAWPVAGVLAMLVLVLALPAVPWVPREAMAVGIGVAVLGLVTSCRTGWLPIGLAACANGIALAALMLGDAELALAASVLALGGAALGRFGRAAPA